MSTATAHANVKNAGQMIRMAGALGRFYQALSGDTVRGMSDDELRAYACLQEAMREWGVIPDDDDPRGIYTADETDAARAAPLLLCDRCDDLLDIGPRLAKSEARFDVAGSS